MFYAVRLVKVEAAQKFTVSSAAPQPVHVYAPWGPAVTAQIPHSASGNKQTNGVSPQEMVV